MAEEKGLYFFVSDIHLGLNYKDPKARERKFAKFIYSLPDNTKAVYLLGDIFDFWYEYKDVIPRGYTRVLGALANAVDKGIKIYFFNGNHDIWTYHYFQNEVGLEVLQQPYVMEINGKWFCIGHGDGLGEGDRGYKLMNSIFKCKFLQFLFSCIHPRWAFLCAHKWSKHNRLVKNLPYTFKGDGESIVKFSESFQKQRKESEKIDYFIFGHYHFKTRYELKSSGTLFMLGEWINGSDYLLFDGSELKEKVF